MSEQEHEGLPEALEPEAEGLTDEENRDVLITDLPTLGENTPDNVLDLLKEQREQVRQNTEVTIPLPGYDQEPPILLARYRLLEGPELERIASKVERETKPRWNRVVLSSVDTFIAACTGMYVDINGDGNPVPMTLGGEPIPGYNDDLAQALGFKTQNAREVVFGVFASNEMAIVEHNAKLSRWMGNTARRVDQGFLGE
jgi:hypothetical protein